MYFAYFKINEFLNYFKLIKIIKQNIYIYTFSNDENGVD